MKVEHIGLVADAGVWSDLNSTEIDLNIQIKNPSKIDLFYKYWANILLITSTKYQLYTDFYSER